MAVCMYRLNETEARIEAATFKTEAEIPKKEGWKDTPAGMSEEIDALIMLRAEAEREAERSKDDEIAGLKAELAALKADGDG